MHIPHPIVWVFLLWVFPETKDTLWRVSSGLGDFVALMAALSHIYVLSVVGIDVGNFLLSC